MKNEESIKLTEILERNPKEINEAIDAEGNTWLHKVVEANDVASLELILSRDITNFFKENNAGYTPWHIAAAKGHLHCLQLIHPHLENIDVRTGGRNQFTALHLALLNGHLKVLCWLINNKADVNAYTIPSQESPLYIAGKLMFLRGVQLLLEVGAIIPDRLKAELPHLYKQNRANSESFSTEELKILETIDYFQSLRLINPKDLNSELHFDYTLKFWTHDYTKDHKRIESRVPSLKCLVISKIIFFNIHKQEEISLKDVRDVKPLYADFTASWAINTFHRPVVLTNYYYSQIIQKLKKSGVDSTYLQTAPLGQCLESTYQKIGDTIKQLALVQFNKELLPEKKLQQFDEELSTLLKELVKLVSENEEAKKRDSLSVIDRYLNKKIPGNNISNLLFKLEIISNFVTALENEAAAESRTLENAIETSQEAWSCQLV